MTKTEFRKNQNTLWSYDVNLLVGIKHYVEFVQPFGWSFLPLCVDTENDPHTFLSDHFCLFSHLYCSIARLSWCVSPYFKQLPHMGWWVLTQQRVRYATIWVIRPCPFFEHYFIICFTKFNWNEQLSNHVYTSSNSFTWHKGEIHYCHLSKQILSL